VTLHHHIQPHNSHSMTNLIIISPQNKQTRTLNLTIRNLIKKLAKHQQKFHISNDNRKTNLKINWIKILFTNFQLFYSSTLSQNKNIKGTIPNRIKILLHFVFPSSKRRNSKLSNSELIFKQKRVSKWRCS
jgi:hypothetical protein